jgi:hypothetical protein
MATEERLITVTLPGGAKIVQNGHEFTIPKEGTICVGFFEGITLRTHPKESNYFVLVKDKNPPTDLTIFKSRLSIVLKVGEKLNMKHPHGQITLDETETFYLTEDTEITVPAGTWLKNNEVFLQTADPTPMYPYIYNFLLKR